MQRAHLARVRSGEELGLGSGSGLGLGFGSGLGLGLGLGLGSSCAASARTGDQLVPLSALERISSAERLGPSGHE